MGIALGIFLAAVGAVLAFAVDDTVSGIDLVVCGWILMAAGALSIVVGLIATWMWRNPRIVHEEHIVSEQRPVGAYEYRSGER